MGKTIKTALSTVLVLLLFLSTGIVAAAEEYDSFTMRYDDRMDISGKTVEIIDEGKPTSYKVGYGVEENAVSDDAVITIDGDKLIATGIGGAKVRIDGVLYEVTVEVAPISLLLLIGQSNMQGIDGNAAQSIVCPDGMVYATYADRYKKEVEDVRKFSPSALVGEYSTINVTGDTAFLENYPVNMLVDSGNGREGMDSGIAYEWVKQTGEKVWTVNVAYGGSSVKEWQKGGVHYNACAELFEECRNTLEKEIAAGHFKLSHMAYFWCQGCADETQTAEWYVKEYLDMHETLKNDFAFDDGTTFEFAGIIPIRAGHSWMGSYREGIYEHTTSVTYYQSFKDLRMNGPRVAQYWMGNNPELSDIWNVCTIQEGWATMPDGTDGVSACFKERYENGTVDYTTQIKQNASWYKPTTPAAVHDNIHYNQIGYNEIGREAARNALILLEEIETPEAETTVKFVGWDGFTEISEMVPSTTGSSATLAVPMVSPIWKSKTVSYETSGDIEYDYYDILAASGLSEGKLSSKGAEGSIDIKARELTSYLWVSDGSGLFCSTENGGSENSLFRIAGSVSNGIFSGIRYQSNQGIMLLHDEHWGLEIEIENWNGSSGSMILSSGREPGTGEPYLYFRPRDFFVGIEIYDGERYHNYGTSLMEKGIKCAEGSHTYIFENRIAEDGSNMIYLIVDGTEIGTLTDHYINSTLSERENKSLCGMDFVFPYFGTSYAPISGCSVNYVAVFETEYDAERHFHSWSDWKTVSEPGPEGPGTEKRVCSGCNEEEIREINGVWQTHALGEHLAELPEKSCAGTNLWSVLPHDEYYYHSGTHWGKHDSGSVYSVTIPINGGDRIYATSFGKYGENGNTIGTGTHGIRVTFFNSQGIEKTLAPYDTYAEFSANNGYITVPENAIAVNVPMYSNSYENELYIINREHNYENGICSTCGEWGYSIGDLNRDGKVNTIDANYARRYAAGLLILDAEQKLAGDVNLDGEVNVIDSAIIRRYVVKRITSLPHKETA